MNFLLWRILIRNFRLVLVLIVGQIDKGVQTFPNPLMAIHFVSEEPFYDVLERVLPLIFWKWR